MRKGLSPEKVTEYNVRYNERRKKRIALGESAPPPSRLFDDRVRDRDRPYNRDRTLLRRFGITAVDYDRMLAEQDGGCALCSRPPGARRLHVDHDHVTGKVRGLLCLPCNGALHYLERGAWLAAAMDYLSR